MEPVPVRWRVLFDGHGFVLPSVLSGTAGRVPLGARYACRSIPDGTPAELRNGGRMPTACRHHRDAALQRAALAGLGDRPVGNHVPGHGRVYPLCMAGSTALLAGARMAAGMVPSGGAAIDRPQMGMACGL